jgi:pimeloyl-ACP methyl ester carboxylesterase
MISRAIATPKNGAAQTRYVIESIDATEALPRIEVPTLVLHSTDNLVYSIEEGRYLADHIKKCEVRGATGR